MQNKHPDASPYEGIHDNARPPCFGRIQAVDPIQRRCTVVTIGRVDESDDLFLQNVQWLSASNSMNGDDDSVLPTVGSYCVVIFVNSEPVIAGFYQVMEASGTDELPGKPALLSGDRVLQTLSGNGVIMRSGGSVEIRSTDLCRFFLLPSRNLLNFVCQEMEFSADGGSFNWETDRDSGDTVMQMLVYDNVEAQNAVRIQAGSTENGALLDIAVGTYDSSTDDVTSPANMEMSVQADGTTFITVGSQNIAIKIDPAGKIAIGIDGKELLKTITQMISDLGQVQALSPLGPCAPLMASDAWQQVMQDSQMIQDITGDLTPPPTTSGTVSDNQGGD